MTQAMINPTENEWRIGIHILTENKDYLIGRESHVLSGMLDRPTQSRQWRVHFDNGYDASIIMGPHAYSDLDNPYELGLGHGAEMCSAPDFMHSDQVVGYLNDETLERILDQIAQLPPNPTCTHRS